MNDEDLVQQFMQEVADRQFSDHTAKKAFTYVKSILDTARDLEVILGNAAGLIPKNRRIPKGVKKAVSQPAVNIDQYVALLNEIKKPRDGIILKILFLCAVRRGGVVRPQVEGLSPAGGDGSFSHSALLLRPHPQD